MFNFIIHKKLDMKTLFIIIATFISTTLYCQKLKNSELQFGIGLSRPDSRIQLRSFKNETPWFEYNFSFTYNFKILSKNKFEIFAGAGYDLNINLFKFIVNTFALAKKGEAIPITGPINTKYFKHSILIPFEARYWFKENSSNKYGVTLGLVPSITLLRHLENMPDYYETTIKVNPVAMPAYMGIRFETNHTGYFLQCRIINLHQLDNVIDHPESGIRLYNPFQLRFGMSVKL